MYLCCILFIHSWDFCLLLQDTSRLEYLIPKKTSLRHRLPMGDQGFIDFVAHLLEINPKKRPSASEALKHPWLSYPYEPISSWPSEGFHGRDSLLHVLCVLSFAYFDTGNGTTLASQLKLVLLNWNIHWRYVLFDWLYLFVAHYQLVFQSFTTTNVIFARMHALCICRVFFFLGISFVLSDRRGMLDLVVHDVIFLLGYPVIIACEIVFWSNFGSYLSR